MTAPIVRAQREWVENCDRCGGSGKIHRREQFALWTPYEYKQVRPLDPKHDAPSDAYVCTAVHGGTIGEACREAIDIAKMVGRPVAFEFNWQSI